MCVVYMLIRRRGHERNCTTDVKLKTMFVQAKKDKKAEARAEKTGVPAKSSKSPKKSHKAKTKAGFHTDYYIIHYLFINENTILLYW